MTNSITNVAWETWFHNEANKFLLYARQQAKNIYDAEDILQDAIISLIKSNKSQKIPESPYIYKAIKNKAIDYARSNIRRLKREEIAHYETNDCEHHWFTKNIEQQERNELLEKKLKELPKDQQEILILKIWGEQTFQQIAKALDISQNTAASRYRYAIQNLQRHLRATDLVEREI